MNAEPFLNACRDSVVALVEALTSDDDGLFVMAVQTCWRRSNEATELWEQIEPDWPAIGEPAEVAWIVSTRAAEAALLILQEARLAFDALDDSVPRSEHRKAFQEAFREWHGWPKDRCDAIRARAYLLAKIQAESEAFSRAHPPDSERLPTSTRVVYTYLSAHPNGVSFSEFTEARNPVTGLRLTESQDVDSIATMLRKHSQALSAIGLRIEVAPKANRIKLLKRNPNQ
jgi:hypothetical protein